MTGDNSSIASEHATPEATTTIDGERRCTECGTSVEDEPYELWLFSTCRDCAEAQTGQSAGDVEGTEADR